jgi:hypothetical protein
MMLSSLANIYSGLTDQLIAMEKLVSESVTRDHLATPIFTSSIAQYRQLLEQQHVIYNLAQEGKSQFGRMSYDQHALLEQSTQNFACQEDVALIAIWQESQKSLRQKQNVANTQIANVSAMQQQTKMFARRIDQAMKMLSKEVQQSFALSPKAEKKVKVISKKKGKVVHRAILAKDIEWHAWVKELGKQVAKLSKARHLEY